MVFARGKEEGEKCGCLVATRGKDKEVRGRRR